MHAFVECPRCRTQNEMPVSVFGDITGVDMSYKPFNCKKCGANISNDQALVYVMMG